VWEKRLLTERSWDTKDDTLATLELLSKVDLAAWVALLKLNVGDRVADFDHIECCCVEVSCWCECSREEASCLCRRCLEDAREHEERRKWDDCLR